MGVNAFGCQALFEEQSLLNIVQEKIEALWRQTGDPQTKSARSFLEVLLYVFSLLYSCIMWGRAFFYRIGIFRSRSLPCQVVSIGNLAVGGTGKTPMTIYVAGLLKQMGFKVAVISRGYRGKRKKSVEVVSDGRNFKMGPVRAGDEPYLMARKLAGVPVLVGKDRYEAGRAAIKMFGSDVLVLDDAFQHLRLRRDLNLLLLDGRRPFGNGYTFPRGALREPKCSLRRADAVILTRASSRGADNRPAAFNNYVTGQSLFRSDHAPAGLFVASNSEPLEIAALKGVNVMTFSGIARCDSFNAMVSGLGATVVETVEFPDHHRYSIEQLRKLWKQGARAGVAAIVSTEKDYVNMIGCLPSASPPLWVLKIAISFGEDTTAFSTFLKSHLPRP